MLKKKCSICNKIIFVKLYRVKKDNFCSLQCTGIFKKGKPSPLKGIKTGRISKTTFKKGHKPWNKEKKCPEISGGKNPFWKGGRRIVNNYLYIYMPKHPYATTQGYIKNARLVLEQTIGRFLKPNEIVHHKGIKYPIGSIENKQDDRHENLKLFPNHSAHKKFHYLLRQQSK